MADNIPADHKWTHVNAIGTATPLATGGKLVGVTINKAGDTNTLTLYDSASGTNANVIAVINTAVTEYRDFKGAKLTNGLAYACAGGTAADVTLLYV